MTRTRYTRLLTTHDDSGLGEHGLFGNNIDHTVKFAGLASLFGLGFQANVMEMETTFAASIGTGVRR